MRIAHFSDPHVLALEGVPIWRLVTNKRVTGYANILLRRAHQHRLEVVRALARDLSDQKVDHVAVTGDVSNLALETEFEAVRELLEDDLRLPPEDVSIVPGNHDRYTRGSHKARRFEGAFLPYMRSDIAMPQGVARDHYPVVKLRGPVAIVGLATGVPRLPFVAAGEVGTVQLRALEWVLRQPEVASRTLVLLTHHPIAEPAGALHAWLEGLRDADDLRRVIDRCPRGLALHGHLHRRMLRIVRTGAGEIWSIGATSASLVHSAGTRMAAYNVYEINDAGEIGRVTSRVLDTRSRTFSEAPVPVLR